MSARRLALRVASGAAAVTLLAGSAPAGAQGTPAAHAGHEATAGRLTAEEIVAYARHTVAVAQARDSIQKQLAMSRNATPQAQEALRTELATRVAALDRAAGFSAGELRRRAYLVSTDSATRATYDAEVVRLTGAPLPGVAPPTDAPLPVPAGAAGVHAGHVANAFGDTPGGRGLLPTALAEARTAVQHAGLALRAPEDLAAIKQHARHVLQTIDPALAGGGGGPGLGYGVKRAALGVATHVELAAGAAGATPAFATHAPHIALAARNAAKRADEIVALARRIEGAGSAADAASLASQLAALTNELLAGRDADANGRVDPAEAGLELCDQHLRLMLGVGR